MTKKQLYNTLYKQFGNLKKDGLWPTSHEEPNLFHAHVNTLIAAGLYLGDYKKEAKKLLNTISNSNLKNNNELYNYSYLYGQKVLERHHSCTQGMIALCFALTGYKKEANNLLNKIYKTKLYDNKKGLFIRSIWSDDSIADRRMIVHSNLWITIALILCDRNKEAKKLLNNIEKESYDNKHKLIIGLSCEHDTVNFFPDDNALYTIALYLIGMKNEANIHLENMLNSGLYNGAGLFYYSWDGENANQRISAYKNHIVQAAFNLCDKKIINVDVLKEDLAYSDSIALGIWALGIKNINKTRS
jgi:hypothetical protein